MSDNGIGKPDASASDSKPRLGTRLIKAVTRQLDAIVEAVSSARRAAVSVTHATFKSKPELPAAESRDVVAARENTIKEHT